MKTYEMTIAGLTRSLPVCPVNEHLDIAGFVIFGDVEMTVACAEALLKKCPDFDYIVSLTHLYSSKCFIFVFPYFL